MRRSLGAPGTGVVAVEMQRGRRIGASFGGAIHLIYYFKY
jgi:hypothetical protein